MKRQLLSFISCICIGTAVHAQTNIFFENFENPMGESFPNWTATERDGDATGMHNTWHAAPAYGVTGFSGQWIAGSFAGTPTTSIDHLFRSPSILLPSGNTFLSFKIASATPDGERYSVYILPAQNTFQGTETPLFTDLITSQDAITRSINIPAGYAGQPVRLYFRHFQQGNTFLYLDDVRVATGSVLGVTESSAVDSNIKVYPNPVKNELYIQSPEKILSTQILDMNGRIMRIKSDHSKIDMTGLGSGMYILKMETKEGTSSKKITKE